MNQPAAVWLVWLPPNRTVIWLGDESRRVERWGKPFHFGLTASASLRLNDPGDSKCQTVPQHPHRPLHLALQYFPEVLEFRVFLFFTDDGKNGLPSKFMRMMLMSVSSILMTLQINWALIEVLLSVWSFFFFLSGQVLWRPLPKRSQQPVKASTLHSHTKRAFSPLNSESACRSLFFFHSFFVILEESLLRGLWSPVELLVLLWNEWEAYYAFSRMTALFKSTPSKSALPAFTLVAVVVSHCFYWPNWRDWQNNQWIGCEWLLMKAEVICYSGLLCERDELRIVWKWMLKDKFDQDFGFKN